MKAAERLFLQMVTDLHQPVLNYLFRLVGDRSVAEDLTQETYLRAYRALERLETGAEAAARRRSWLYRIAHNVATDHLRRRALLAWLPIDLPSLAGRLRTESDPAADLAAADPVRRALARLPAEHREALVLFLHDDLAADEVAEVLGITPEAARKRLQRARQSFRAALAVEEPDHEV